MQPIPARYLVSLSAQSEPYEPPTRSCLECDGAFVPMDDEDELCRPCYDSLMNEVP